VLSFVTTFCGNVFPPTGITFVLSLFSEILSNIFSKLLKLWEGLISNVPKSPFELFRSVFVSLINSNLSIVVLNCSSNVKFYIAYIN
jgi:hypothetical protein